MNAFLDHATATIPKAVQRRQERVEKPLSALELKMREKQRLSRAFRAWRRAEVKAVLASEPRLAGFLRYLRTVTAETGDELLKALAACEWLKAAPLPVRIFALRMVNARADHINRRLGNEALDDPIPPETNIYFEVKRFLHSGGRA